MTVADDTSRTHPVHLTSVHQPFDARIFHRELKSLTEREYEPTLIAHTKESMTLDGVRIRSAGTVESRTRRWANLPNIYRMARYERADIYHIHDPELIPIGVLLSIRTDAKVIYDIHEDYADAIRVREWIPDLLKPLLAAGFPIIQGFAARYFDLIVTADSGTRRQLRERTNTPVVRVRNFPRVRDVDFDAVDVQRSHEHVLVYVGGLDRERGLFEMLEVTSALRASGVDVALWLLGPFQNEDVKREASKYIEGAGIADNVRLFGYVDHEKIFSHLTSADVGLLLANNTRFTRNVPTKFFEYLYAGLPVVSTKIPSLSEYRSDQYCVTVPSEKVEATATAISSLLSDSEKRGQMGAMGHKKVLTEYSWESEQEQLLDAYRKL